MRKEAKAFYNPSSFLHVKPQILGVFLNRIAITSYILILYLILTVMILDRFLIVFKMENVLI